MSLFALWGHLIETGPNGGALGGEDAFVVSRRYHHVLDTTGFRGGTAVWILFLMLLASSFNISSSTTTTTTPPPPPPPPSPPSPSHPSPSHPSPPSILSCQGLTCGPGLRCGNCAAMGKARPFCMRGKAIIPTTVIGGLPFNKYSWLMTHNSFSIENAAALAGVQRVTFYNQDDTVTSQLMQPAINTLKEVETFLSRNPTQIITIIIEDHVRTPHALTKLFEKAGLKKYWFPVSKMPKSGEDWPTVTEMVKANQRLVVFSSVASREQSEGIAYQWKYLLENEAGDAGLKPGRCSNRKESQPLTSKSASLILMNFYTSLPSGDVVCKEHSSSLVSMIRTCYRAAGNRMPNFLAVDFYRRSGGGGAFYGTDVMNGQTLCGCNTITACQHGKPFGSCRNVVTRNT
ncbi:hypothetical protein V6N13_044745 [Hibiscus sabdariffa]